MHLHRNIKTIGLAAAASLALAAPASAATVKANDNWGDVSRNVIGAATTEYRPGPAGNPFGPHSLQIDVADGASKAAFGNEVDYRGRALSTVSQFGFSVFQTGENATPNPENLPSVGVEIDPDSTSTVAPNFSTLVSVPTAAPVNAWSSQIATRYFLTGAAGTATGCNQVTYCTLAEVQTRLPNASILTVQITKGRDAAWHGSVDGLVIGADTIDFGEPAVVAPVPGPAGPAGAPAATPVAAAPAAASAPAARASACTGNAVRTLHAPSRKGERFLRVAAALKTPNGFRSLKTVGRAVTLDLTGKPEGNYNVRLISRYRTAGGKVRRVVSTRNLSVACA